MHFGGHVGTAGGIDTSIGRARELGASAMQVFTQSPRQWRHPEIADDAARRFREGRTRARIADVACHATYLINLGSADDTTYHRSVRALRDTMAAAGQIEADSVVVHLGSHLGRGLDAALHQVVPAVQIVLGDTAGAPTWLLFENTAGAGDTLGRTIEELARVMDELGWPDRLGVCLDTCHLWASGVDISDPGRVQELVDEVDERIGLDRLRCLHVNDAAVRAGRQPRPPCPGRPGRDRRRAGGHARPPAAAGPARNPGDAGRGERRDRRRRDRRTPPPAPKRRAPVGAAAKRACLELDSRWHPAPRDGVRRESSS